MRTLALILARAGSKRLPGKNIKHLLDKPLLAWSIESALNTPSIGKVLVSTDSEEMQKVAIQYGAEAPFLRPEELSSDKATSVDAALHALAYADEKWGAFDALVLLEPTSPLRKKEDLGNGIQTLKDNFADVDGVVSLGKIHLENPNYCKQVHGKFIEPIEVKPASSEYYFPYGVLYLVKTSVLKNQKAFYTDKMMPYYIERWQNYEVDDIYDFHCVETILKMKMNEVCK
ncbi:MAG: cytidylyltransferase domain-containing protein [Bdellovibrio sp.]